MRLAVAVGIGTGLIFLAFLPPGIYSIDGNSMLALAESLVTKRDFTVPPALGMPGRDGQHYSSWYPLLSILAVPLVAIGLAVGRLFNLSPHYVAAICAVVLPALLTAVTAAMVVRLSLRLGATERGACLAALSFGFGTIALAYARTFFAEPLLALITVAGVYLAFEGRHSGILGAGALAGLAVLTKPTGVILGPVLALYLVARRRELRAAIIPLIGTGAGLFLYGIYNVARFGHPLTFGPPWAFDVASIPEGFAGLLLSPGRGVLWYCPPVVLSLIGFRRVAASKALEAWAIVGLFLGFLLMHSFWTVWTGGWSWGPRLLLPAIPGLLVLSGLADGRWRRGLVVLTIAGFLVNAPTLVSFYERYYAEAHERGIPERALLWSPSHSPLVHAWGAAYRQTRDALNSDVKVLVKEAGTPDESVASGQILRVVALWWWMLPAAGIPRWIGAVLAALLVGGGVLVIRSAMMLAENGRGVR